MIKVHQKDTGNATGIFHAFSIANIAGAKLEIFVDSRKIGTEMKIVMTAIR
jgi:hypothetical protein